MTLKELVIEQLSSTHNQMGWFVPVNDALSDLTAGMALWQPGGESHSIWQIVNHLIFWNERWLTRFKGGKVPKMEGDNRATFRPGRVEQDWKKTVEALDKILTEWENALKEKSEAELDTPVVEGEKDTWYSYLSSLSMHNAYHIGQIVTIRKLQGSWDPDMGVAT